MLVCWRVWFAGGLADHWMSTIVWCWMVKTQSGEYATIGRSLPVVKKDTSAMTRKHNKRVEILDEEIVFKRFIFRIVQARLRHELYNGEMSETLTRLSLLRGDSVAVLMHDPDAETIILTEQFRYPTYEKTRASSGWLMEIPAGSGEVHESPEKTISREILEEIGYRLNNIERISTFYVSPGGTSERIILYYARVSPKDRVAEGGGLAKESEDIRTIIMPVSDALKKLQKGDFHDAKTIIALQWLELNQSRLASLAGSSEG
jgi:nudix-type nucleoside diphosphatase (YffH/AdpP family)